MFGTYRKRIAQIALVILTIVVFVYAKSEGPDPGYTGAPGDIGDCTACHDTFVVPNVGAGKVTIGSNPAVYQPGQSYTLTITVQDSKPDRRRWGFQLTAIDGTGGPAGSFSPLDGFTQTVSGGPNLMGRQYIEHTQPGTFLGTSGGHTWQVKWTAPGSDLGTVRFFAAGNAADGTGTNQNDYIYTTTTSSESVSSNVTVQIVNGPDSQTLQAGSTFNIDWSATGLSNVASYEVRYSTDDGATFPINQLILSTTDPTVTQTVWTVPNTPTTQARIRVQASTKSASAATAVSGRFVIAGSGGTSPPPIITSVTQTGRQLFVTGQNFQQGAKVQLNGDDMKTVNEDDFSHLLFCKKAGKFISPGSTVMITVTNPDGTISIGFAYTRPST
jgi:hypothetical protein